MPQTDLQPQSSRDEPTRTHQPWHDLDGGGPIQVNSYLYTKSNQLNSQQNKNKVKEIGMVFIFTMHNYI